MRILVTGAAGFIGGHVARLAAASGHEVLGLARERPDEAPFRFCRGTLAEAPWPEIVHFQPEACLHAAWHAKPGVFWDATENELCTSESLAFIRSLWERTNCHVLALGTCAEYASSPQPLGETSPLKPESGYAKAKHHLREELESAAAAHGREFGWARIFYPYGPGEPGVKITSALIASALRGDALVVRHPRSVKDFIYIGDVAAALLGLLEIRATGPVNIASGVGVQIEDLAHAIVELAGKGRVETRPSETPDPLGIMVGNVECLRRLIPSLPTTGLRTGLGFLKESLDRVTGGRP